MDFKSFKNSKQRKHHPITISNVESTMYPSQRRISQCLLKHTTNRCATRYHKSSLLQVRAVYCLILRYRFSVQMCVSVYEFTCIWYASSCLTHVPSTNTSVCFAYFPFAFCNRQTEFASNFSSQRIPTRQSLFWEISISLFVVHPKLLHVSDSPPTNW